MHFIINEHLVINILYLVERLVLSFLFDYIDVTLRLRDRFLRVIT